MTTARHTDCYLDDTSLLLDGATFCLTVFDGIETEDPVEVMRLGAALGLRWRPALVEVLSFALAHTTDLDDDAWPFADDFGDAFNDLGLLEVALDAAFEVDALRDDPLGTFLSECQRLALAVLYAAG